MDTTDNLALPYIHAAQAQKHITHNEALRALDALVQIGVLDRHLTTPPVTPAAGDRYLLPASPTGAWAGQAGRIAAWQDGAWAFFLPKRGWLLWVADEAQLLAHNGTTWVAVANLQNVAMVGINAAADTTNRLALASIASLFNHAGAGHQIKINKNTAGDTASLLYQTAFSGRAEMGTAGDDKWHLKVSPDGTTWHEALVVDPSAGGYIGLGTPTPLNNIHVKSAGSASIYLEADTDNSVETHNPYILMTQDGGTFHSFLGLSGDVGIDPEGQPLTNGQGNCLTLGTRGTTPIQLSTNGALRAFVSTTGNVGIATPTPSTTLHVNGPVRVASYTVAGLPTASIHGPGTLIYVSNEAGGAVLAFSDGTNWRRVTDRAVVA